MPTNIPKNPEDDELEKEEIDEELTTIMQEHDLDKDTAERVKELMDDEGIDEDEAVELEELL